MGLLIVTGLSLMLANSRAAERIETTNRVGIKLSYLPAAKLDETELRQVLWLAQQVGVTNVAEVNTSYAAPSATKLVSVISKERVDGRNISYETVAIHRPDWGAWSKPERVLQSGDFWVSASDKITWLQRTFDIGGTTRRITLEERDIPVADIAIPLIVAKKVQFKDDFWTRTRFEKISLMQPAGFRKSGSTNNYELWLHGSHEVIHFRIDKGQVTITGIGDYDV